MGSTSCTEGQETLSCTPGTAGSQDSVCNGLDDDCNGGVDEDYVVQTSACGIGACTSTGIRECMQGALSDSCQPREPLPDDSTCNGLDDDCDGSVDEDYAGAVTSCGRGACLRTGAMVCSAGTLSNSCAPGVPANDDAACNAQDDDCDGSLDEDYVPAQILCGTGACVAVGSTACVEGQVANSCIAGGGSPSDPICNGIDEDCDGIVDEDAVAHPTSCGVGACATTGVVTCSNGSPIDSCQPGTPAASDAVCDGEDEDCDGRTDEEYESLATHCGVGLCSASGATACVSGMVVDSCAPHPPAPNDSSCDDRDDDCDGRIDEGYTGIDTICGIGACRTNGRTVCVQGTVADSCVPAPAGLDDATCNGVDDDCGGAEDEDYEPMSTQCGLGACRRSGQLDCVEGQLQNTCQPGTGSPIDLSCDASDDDCDGRSDEDYQPHATQCGVGACTSSGTTQCQNGSELDTCTSGAPSTLDVVCDGRDEDCDGRVDENYAAQPTQCGVGACVATGQVVCVSGVLTTQCSPGSPVSPSDSTCDGVDQDCDGQFDEDYAGQTTTCGIGVCMGQGELSCVGGLVVDSCQLRPSCEANCDDGADDDADGWIDCRDSDCAGHCELYCWDGVDDDADGDTDCADFDCAGQTGCIPEICGNSLDDDADGLIDCADLGDCSGAVACPPIPPAAESVAPSVEVDAAYTLLDRVSFLFTGADPIQRGVSAGTIQEERVSVLAGGVTLSDGRPLPGVEIRTLGHPEFGLTHTDELGHFQMVVNGGGMLTVNYALPGYITSQRQVEVRWQGSGTVDDIVMMPRSPVASMIDVSGTATDYQVGAARSENDVDGSRRAVVVFPPGIAAQVFDATGAVVNVPSLNLRLTEVTVGPRGRDAMPAELPPSSGYTYAIDITPDEAQGIKVQGRDTILSAPVSFYVDNFLRFPTGTSVPTGYYDETAAVWKAVDNGLVIDIVGETGWLAEIDTSGDGIAESASTLSALAITEGERRVIASQYGAGDSIWRVRLPHLSFYDMNMGAGPNGQAAPPEPPDDSDQTQNGAPNDPNNPRCDTSGSPNSVIDCFGQVLGEEVPVAGTPYTMHYRSDRVLGRLASRQVKIPVRTSQLDALLQLGPGGTCVRYGSGGVGGASAASLSLAAADGGFDARVCLEHSPTHAFVRLTPHGQKAMTFRWTSAAAPPVLTWTWEGKDDFGRAVTGPIPVSIVVGYEYGCDYSGGARFGEYGGSTLDVGASRTYFPRTDCSVSLVRNSVRTLEYWDSRQTGVAGWSINVNHRAASSNEILYGDGSRSNTDRTPATEIAFTHNQEMARSSADFAIGANGTMYFAGTEGVYRQPWGGVKQLWVPTSNVCNADPNQNRLCGISSIAVAPNGDVYVGDYLWDVVVRVMRIRPDGTLQRVAGGVAGYSPNGGPALTVSLQEDFRYRGRHRWQRVRIGHEHADDPPHRHRRDGAANRGKRHSTPTVRLGGRRCAHRLLRIPCV
jgi:hypothetical protein